MYYFPYTNFHDINLDWIIEYVKSAKSEIEDLINQFENLIVQTTGDSTNKVMSQNAVTTQLNFLSSRINTLNTTVEELTAKLNEDIANLAEFETETASNFSSDRNRLSTIENTLTRFYVVITHTATENTINVSMSELLNYRTRANVRYYITDRVNNFIRSAYESSNPTAGQLSLKTLPFSNENACYTCVIDIATSNITYSQSPLVSVSQSSGTSQTTVMSQRAVTEFVNNLSLYVKFTITADTSRCNYSFATIQTYITNKQFVYGDVTFVEKNARYYCSVYSVSSERIYFRAIPSYDSNQSLTVVLNSNDEVSYTQPTLGVLPYYPRYVITSDGKTISSPQLAVLQNIFNAIVVNNYSPQIYLKIITDDVIEQLYVDSANSTGYVLRNNNYIITYNTTAPSATIEPVEKVFTSSVTGITRIAAGGATGYSILKISGTDVDLTNYYIVDADITNLIGGDSTLISVSSVSGVPVILIYTSAVAFSGSWTVTCRHK